MKNLLITERWRPKSLDDAIILPRIKKLFEDGMNSNYLLYGNFGIGKTTLARILIGKYKKTSPFLEINSSFHTSIDTLRNQIDEFCSKVYMGIDLEEDVQKDTIKFVFLDEFDRTSIQYQDALKAYIEEYSTKNVRFILTTNHINKISPGIRSRCVEVNFDAINMEEEKFLKREFFKKIIQVICPKENISIEKSELVKIINKNFPDFRSTLISLENYSITGTTDESFQVNEELKKITYEIIFSKTATYEEIYNLVISKYGQDKINELILILGKPFIDYCIANKISVQKMFEANYIICEYGSKFENSTDPVVLAMAILGKFKELFVN